MMSTTQDLEHKLNSVVAQLAVLNMALAATVNQLTPKKRAAAIESFNSHAENLMASMLNTSDASDAFIEEIQLQSHLFRNILLGRNTID